MKYNYPIKYAVLPIKEKEYRDSDWYDVCYVIVKCFVLEEKVEHHLDGIMRLDEKIRYGMAYSSRIIKYGEELINISMYDANANTDYNNSQEYYYGCSISDDAKRHNNYYEFELEDVIKFHTDNKDNVKVLQKQNIYKTR